MTNPERALCWAAVLWILGGGARPAVAGPESFDALDLSDLLELEVSVASLKALSLRESPGIVTVVTSQEMRSWGARDLVDVLTLVPGFFFGVDVQGVVGVGIRGNWAHEGKVLVLLDGFELNELNFQTFQFGHHIPIEAIDRVEVIRGPGSAIYGGNAELGVIHVITRRPEVLEGGLVALRYGPPSGFYDADGDDLGFLDATASAGATHGDFAWSLTAFAGRSVRSEDTYVPLVGESYRMADASEIRPLLVQGSLRLGTTELRVLYDGYGYDSRDAFDAPTTLVQPYLFGGLYADLRTRISLFEGVTLTPHASYKRQLAYFTLVDRDDVRAESLEVGTYLRQATTRVLGGANLGWDISDRANLIVGAEASYDLGERLGEAEDSFVENAFLDDEGNPTRARIEFVNTALFTQLLWLNDVVNVTAGGRLEIHSEFGAYAVPRLALTKVFDFGLHGKILAAQAFRTPSLKNRDIERSIDLENRVERERTTVLEAEVGYLFLERLQVTANGYFSIIEDPIIYVFDVDADEETYVNRGTLRTVGGEVQLTYRDRSIQGELGYATYAVVDDIEDYEVPGSSARLGAPQHKITARLSWEAVPGFRITPTVVYQGERHGFTQPGADAPNRVEDQLLLGLGLTGEDVLAPGLGVGLFAHNLLDHRATFIQPYAGGHGLLPGPGRQVLLRLSYQYDR